MLPRLFGALLAVALLTYPVEAAQKRKPDVNNVLATCVLSLIVIGWPFGCSKARLSSQGKGKAQVTIHKPEAGRCANGNTYRVMRVSDPAHVCRNSFKRGRSVPACVNLSFIGGKAVGLIIVNKQGAHLAHEIRHVCDP